MTLQHWTTNGKLKSWQKLTSEEGLRVIRKADEWWKIQRFEGIHPKKALVSLGSTGPLLGQMDGWLGICNTYSVNSYGNKLDSKNDHFGSGLFTNDVINLKHQGACQKLMIGWHKHQGVSETPKIADVICEQPLICTYKIKYLPHYRHYIDTLIMWPYAGGAGMVAAGARDTKLRKRC